MNDQQTPFTPASLKWHQQAVLVTLLIAVGIASRFVLTDWPNFKPVLAIAIFCGFLCSSRWPVLLAISAMMLISDLVIGFYDWRLMVGVYAGLFVACCVGSLLPRLLNRPGSVAAKLGGITGASLAASAVFFLLTNAATWLIGWYPAGFGGLLDSLIAGIPFLKYSLAGDLFFSVLLFSAWYAITARVTSRNLQPTASQWAGKIHD